MEIEEDWRLEEIEEKQANNKQEDRKMDDSYCVERHLKFLARSIMEPKLQIGTENKGQTYINACIQTHR